MPFATIVSSDNYDSVSNLSRLGVFRLNIGVEKATYRDLFGPPPPQSEYGTVVETGHDFAVLDQLLPHPTYASQSWVCIVSPGAETFETIKPLLREAYNHAVKQHAKVAQKS